jgi:Zn-dependent peptidase ImmA (M78 family)
MSSLLLDMARIIREEREARGLSNAQLAERANVRLERLEALEAGKPGLGTVDLDRLADVLELDAIELADGRRVQGISAAIFLRQGSTGYQDFNPNDADIFVNALAQGKALFSLCTQGNVTKFSREEVRKGPDHAPAKQGHELAQHVRSKLELELEPLGDMRELLEEHFGIAVIQASLASKRLPAACARDTDRRGAAVILNANDQERQTNPLVDRVHLAHELCHILFDPMGDGVQLVMEVEGKEDLFEQRARAFAAELLVPSSSFAELLEGKDMGTNAGARQAAIRIRERFKVPWEVTVQQLVNHKKLSEARAEELLDAGPGNYFKPATKLPAPGQPSLGLCKALENALTEGDVTEGQVRSLLGLYPGQPFPWEAHGTTS